MRRSERKPKEGRRTDHVGKKLKDLRKGAKRKVKWHHGNSDFEGKTIHSDVGTKRGLRTLNLSG